jgi:hypothetical protein
MTQTQFDAINALTNAELATVDFPAECKTPIHLAAYRLAVIWATFQALEVQ